MDLSQIAGSIPLRSGQLLRIDNGAGRRITVVEGHVWLTQAGDPRDIVLGAGDAFHFDRSAAALVSPLGTDARIAAEDGLDIGAID